MSVKESGEEMADKFLVIDGSSLIHRAFFALPPLMTKQGVHTGAVYGFCNMLVKLLGDIKPNGWQLHLINHVKLSERKCLQIIRGSVNLRPVN